MSMSMLFFNVNVSVVGYPRIKLASATGYCYARYYRGSNEKILQFLYLTNGNGGTNKLACNSIESFDTTHGNIYRFSGNPEISANITIEVAFYFCGS